MNPVMRVSLAGVLCLTIADVGVGDEDLRATIHELHMQGLTGKGVTVAVIDSGAWKESGVLLDTRRAPRVKVFYDAMAGRERQAAFDENGHGTHVTSLMVSSMALDRERFLGIAPDAGLVIVRAFDRDGRSDVATVVRAIDYVAANATRYGIDVLNLSWSGAGGSTYCDDSVTRAATRAWRAGITVIAAAGNDGPHAGTVGTPGSSPLIITVGAADGGLPVEYSGAGPTTDGFAKPDLIAPGEGLLGYVRPDLRRTLEDDGHGAFRVALSGTSQATAVVSGIAALMYQQDPGLSPDDLKCRLVGSATELGEVTDEQRLQSGAGLLDPHGAVYSSLSGCANVGDYAADALGEGVCEGRASEYQSQGFIWNVGYLWSGALRSTGPQGER